MNFGHFDSRLWNKQSNVWLEIFFQFNATAIRLFHHDNLSYVCLNSLIILEIDIFYHFINLQNLSMNNSLLFYFL